jgi:hypothetical protein
MLISTSLFHFNDVVFKTLMFYKVGTILFTHCSHFSFLDHFCLFFRFFFDCSTYNLSSCVSYLSIIFLFLNLFNNMAATVKLWCIWLFIFLFYFVKLFFCNQLTLTLWKLSHFCIWISNMQHITISETSFGKSIGILGNNSLSFPLIFKKL